MYKTYKTSLADVKSTRNYNNVSLNKIYKYSKQLSGLLPIFFITRPISPVTASFKIAFQYWIHTVFYFNITALAGSSTCCPLPSCILHQEALGRRGFFLVKPTTYKIEEHEEAWIWDSGFGMKRNSYLQLAISTFLKVGWPYLLL